MENKEVNILLNSKGQSTVEYILLFVVVTSLSMVVFKSRAFQEMVGEGMFVSIARSMEFTARYGKNGNQDGYPKTYSDPLHPLYYNDTQGSGSRFFTPEEKYE